MEIWSEHQQHQIQHCIDRLRERFGFGPEAYYQILDILQSPNRKQVLLWPGDGPGVVKFRLIYLGVVVVGVLDTKTWHLVTVY